MAAIQQIATVYRGFIQGKTRILMAWIFSALLVLTTRNYPTLPGIVVCFLGASVRFWASGYLRKDQELAVGGPYRFTRNPLYFGTYLMALGTALAIENYWLLGVITVLFAVVYHYIILDEETKLQGKFKAPYGLYSQNVNRFFPQLRPARREVLIQVNSDPMQAHFSWPLAICNKAYEAYASFAGLIGFVTLVAFLWKNT